MKKYFLTILFLLITNLNANAALNLICYPYYDELANSAQLLVYGGFDAWCLDPKDEHKSEKDEYHVSLWGVGPGLILSDVTFAMTCPTVSKRRLEKRGKIQLLGGHAEAAVGVGVHTGAAVNVFGGTCALAGFSIGLGAQVRVGVMTIYNKGEPVPNN